MIIDHESQLPDEVSPIYQLLEIRFKFDIMSHVPYTKCYRLQGATHKQAIFLIDSMLHSSANVSLMYVIDLADNGTDITDLFIRFTDPLVAKLSKLYG